VDRTDTGRGIGPANRPAVAALALHGLPEGFTWEMVDSARRIGKLGECFEDRSNFKKLLANVMALLPPRSEGEVDS